MGININHSKNTIKTEDKLTIEATNNVSVTNNRITDVQDPIDPQDAVTKKFLEDAIANLTNITDLLVPQQPPELGSKTLDLVGDTAYRITDFTQPDNTGSGLFATAGSIVTNVLRNDDYATSTITQVGPGTSGTLSVVRNGVTTASLTFDDTDNSGTYTDVDSLLVTNNVDYGTITGDTLGFFQCYDVRALGSNNVLEGWNNVKLVQDASETNTVTWYSDQSNPGAPTVTNISVTPDAVESTAQSSTIPHYTSAQVFNITFDVAKLSGDFYPTSDQFFTAGNTVPSTSSLDVVPDLTYQTVGMPAPLPQNYLAASTFPVSTSTTVKGGTGIGSETSGPTATVNNSYATTTATFAPGVKVLRLDTTQTSVLNELSIPVINVGFGSGNAKRVETIDGDTPNQTSFIDLFTSASSTLNAWDATVVGGILTHDTTNYTTGYLPVGPDLSTGRDGSQYFEVVFYRSAVSKFAIKWSGKASGCWVKLPGTQIDTTSTLNGWLDATTPYDGSGVPGANTAFGGNGSNGCSLGGPFSTGVQVLNENVDITFGTESSSNATGYTIVVRFKLEAGDNISAISFVAAS